MSTTRPHPTRRATSAAPPVALRPALRAALLVPLAALALVAVACGDDGTEDGAPAPGREAAEVALADGATVIDVRTPEEYGAGHVEGAELIDVQNPDFDARIAALDPEVDYVVYCRSGNRSAQAAARMEAEGLTVLDGGGLDDMVAAGWPETS